MPGCERIVCTWLQKKWLSVGDVREDVSAAVVAPDLLGPESLFMVKGWNRAVSALGVLLAAYQNEELFKARSNSISFRFISHLYLFKYPNVIMTPMARHFHRMSCRPLARLSSTIFFQPSNVSC